jgi:hypothetical protein
VALFLHTIGGTITFLPYDLGGFTVSFLTEGDARMIFARRREAHSWGAKLWLALLLSISLILLSSTARAQSPPEKLKAVPLGDSTKAEVSVAVSDSTFAFGTNLLDSWLAPQSSMITNDGTVAENFLGSISQFTDGTNNWTLDASSNGADSVRAQWSITSDSGPWTDVSAYDTDFTIATNVAVNDSVDFWFRIQTPTGTSSYDEHSSTLTVTAQQY